ncbi:MAG: N-6 DNA methylase [bacterium]
MTEYRNSGREKLDDIIKNFSPEKFSRFFREKNRSFSPKQESISHYDDESFRDGLNLGEIKFSETEKLIVCSFQVKQSLSERSGKKAQYEKGKKILKDTQSDAGIFIFYDSQGNFRFSLIYLETIENRRQGNNFRRFTYFVSHEFTNRTYLTRIGDGDLSSLEKIKDAFSVEKVTKEFYEDIANWYFWTVQCCHFPKDAEAEENGRNIAIIRLITRIIFIWFMRELGLVPKELFEKENIASILKELPEEDSSYYTAILQNLFFATLSTKKEDRQFGSEVRGYKGCNPDFGNQYVFRYQELFKTPEKIKEYFDNIPFLNGGLFECLDDRKNGIIIDGFSRTKKNQPTVPNSLFFSGERKINLNAEYGTNNKTYKVRGLLDILSSFNFTIDENSSYDADVALDPELLGRVFENLLASFNPETSTTARKATGSYYTPREIVNYMVTESLKAYFKTHLPDIKDIDQKLIQLFSTGSKEPPFDKSESKKIVDLIESIRIVDPAVGSGAFPMGVLNNLVFVLNKIDPGNELWKQAQIKAANAIPDPIVRRDTKSRIEEFFKGKNADYGRKLYLIQRCIYGVDIQQIAVEIAKLRFFISLLVDEKIDKTKENWGIEPLPNLDFKIMQGNSLISEFMGIDFDNGHEKQEFKAGVSFEQEDHSLIKEFEQKKVDFQNESDKDKKQKLKTEIENLMIKIFESKVKKQKADYFKQLNEIEQRYSVLPNKQTREENIAKEKQKLAQKTGFDLEDIEKQLREFTSKKKTRPFFPWKLYFAEVFLEKGGFDVVIGNPPYGADIGEKELEKIKRNLRNTKNTNSAAVFIDYGINRLVNPQGTLTFIVPKSLLFSEGWFDLVKAMLGKVSILVDVEKAFENVKLEQVVFLYGKTIKNNSYLARKFLDNEFIRTITIPNNLVLKYSAWICDVSEEELLIAEKATSNQNIYMREISQTKRGVPLQRFLASEGEHTVIGGKNIFRYGIDGEKGFITSKYLVQNRKKISFLNQPKIVSQNIVAHIQNPTPRIMIMAAMDTSGNVFSVDTVNNTVLITKEYDLRYILALMNCRFTSWFAYRFIYCSAIRTMHFDNYYVGKIPVVRLAKDKQEPFINLVDKILTTTKDEDYLTNPTKQARVKEYSHQIDQMVYELYGLSDDEIEIVEGIGK